MFDEPLAHREGEATVTFCRTDGRKLVLDHVRVDSVGPNGVPGGVIGVEFFDSDEVIHVPFVESWTFSYRFDF